MNNRKRIHLEIRNSPSRLKILAALFVVAIAIASPLWPAKAQGQPEPGLSKFVSLDQVPVACCYCVRRSLDAIFPHRPS